MSEKARCMMIAFTLTHILLSVQSSASDDVGLHEQKFGIEFLEVFNMHEPDFAGLRGIVSCCPSKYDHEHSHGISIGLLFQQALDSDFSLGTRVSFKTFDVDFSKQRQTLFAGPLDTNNLNTIVDGVLTTSIDAELSGLEFGVTGQYRLVNKLSVFTGVNITVLLTGKAYHREEISEPAEGIVFLETGRNLRNEFDGEIPFTSSVLYGWAAGIGYEIALDDRESWFVEPRITYSLGLNSLVQHNSWLIDHVSFGVAFTFSPHGLPLPPTEPGRPDLPIWP